MNNANEPSTPCKVSVNRETGELQPFQFGNNDFETLGLTKREYFAGLAMQAILANPNENSGMESAAFSAVYWADELLAELERAE